jgi:hypothetical protein
MSPESHAEQRIRHPEAQAARRGVRGVLGRCSPGTDGICRMGRAQCSVSLSSADAQSAVDYAEAAARHIMTTNSGHWRRS